MHSLLAETLDYVWVIYFLALFIVILYAVFAGVLSWFEISIIEVQYKVFGLVMGSLSLWDIEEVRLVSWRELLLCHLFALHLGGYYFQKKAVLIRKRAGIPRTVILYPRRPEEFVAELLQRMANLGISLSPR